MRATSSVETGVLILHDQMPLGCCVHATPIFAAIKAAQPEMTIAVATRGLAAQTFRHDPHIDLLLEASPQRGSMRAMAGSVRRLREEVLRSGWRPGIILQPASDRTGSNALFAQALRLAPTAGFASAPQLYDTYLAYDPERSLIDNNLRLAQLLGARAEHVEPAVYFTAAELAAAERMLREANPEGRPTCAFVMQGSGGQRTGWHEDRFAAVIRHVEARGFATVFLGTAADAEGIEGIATLAEARGVSLAGKTSVPELAALLANCDLMVSLDTGTMHVGRAAGLPMVVLGPSWQRPIEWLPLGRANVRVLRGVDRASVPADYRLDEIEADEVIAAAEELAAAYPALAEQRATRAARLLSAMRA